MHHNARRTNMANHDVDNEDVVTALEIVDVYSVVSGEAKELIVPLAFIRRDIKNIEKKDDHFLRHCNASRMARLSRCSSGYIKSFPFIKLNSLCNLQN